MNHFSRYDSGAFGFLNRVSQTSNAKLRQIAEELVTSTKAAANRTG